MTTFPKIENKELEGMPLEYRWFVNGEEPLPRGQSFYCFPSEGRYSAELNIVDTNYEKIIYTKEVYEFMVTRVEQPFTRSLLRILSKKV